MKRDIRNDLTKFTDRELALQVFNTEGLYKMFKTVDAKEFEHYLRQVFKFTQDQLDYFNKYRIDA